MLRLAKIVDEQGHDIHEQAQQAVGRTDKEGHGVQRRQYMGGQQTVICGVEKLHVRSVATMRRSGGFS